MTETVHAAASAEAGGTGRTLPWSPGETPLMLAPMQGLTNRALRSLFIEWVRPDLVFTEFMRVKGVGKKRLVSSDLRDVRGDEEGVPLVVQLIGHGRDNLVDAARAAEDAGALHLNLNMGCPFGRMTTGITWGAMLRHPEELREILPALRRAISGTFSVKLRAGYDEPGLVLDLLPLFEGAGVDFIVLHPRTVVQKYGGKADHAVTAEVVRLTRLPVIANGDIRTAADGWRVLEETGAAGLMLGRGAIADPWLFERLRRRAPAEPKEEERRLFLQRYLRESLRRYRGLFCGEAQVLAKLKEVLSLVDEPDLARLFKELRKAKSLDSFDSLLDALG